MIDSKLVWQFRLTVSGENQSTWSETSFWHFLGNWCSKKSRDSRTTREGRLIHAVFRQLRAKLHSFWRNNKKFDDKTVMAQASWCRLHFLELPETGRGTRRTISRKYRNKKTEREFETTPSAFLFLSLTPPFWFFYFPTQVVQENGKKFGYYRGYVGASRTTH